MSGGKCPEEIVLDPLKLLNTIPNKSLQRRIPRCVALGCSRGAAVQSDTQIALKIEIIQIIFKERNGLYIQQ